MEWIRFVAFAVGYDMVLAGAYSIHSGLLLALVGSSIIYFVLVLSD